jgi:superfamily II DNA helicase RecQ
LIGLGLLEQTDDAYPVLRVTRTGVELLKNENAVPGLALARQRVPKKGEARVRSHAEAESWEGVDRGLFEHLRGVRLDVARSRGVPPYVIFHDATLPRDGAHPAVDDCVFVDGQRRRRAQGGGSGVDLPGGDSYACRVRLTPDLTASL